MVEKQSNFYIEMFSYKSSFEALTNANSEYSYGLKIEQKSRYGGWQPKPIRAYLQEYKTFFHVIPLEKENERFQNGYFYATPNGPFLISYKMNVDGKIEERSEVCDFYEYPKHVNETPQSNENFAKKKLRQQVSNYVINSNDISTRSIIASKINKMWPTLDRELTVYRGQKDAFTQEIRTAPETFFSTSLEKSTASLTFTSRNDKCCLFILHLQPGVKYYSVPGDNLNEVLEHVNNGSLFEAEILVEGNGKFYQDKAKTTPGFKELTIEELNARNVDRSLFGPKTHTKNGKTLEQKSGIFEAYYFAPETRENEGTNAEGESLVFEGGLRKKYKKTRKTNTKKSKKSKTRKH